MNLWYTQVYTWRRTPPVSSAGPLSSDIRNRQSPRVKHLYTASISAHMSSESIAPFLLLLWETTGSVCSQLSVEDQKISRTIQ